MNSLTVLAMLLFGLSVIATATGGTTYGPMASISFSRSY